MLYHNSHKPVYTFNSCNPELTAANQMAFPRRHTCISCCNAANSIYRDHSALSKWSDPNSTSVNPVPAVETQFGCEYTIKHCPGPCDRPRKCHPLF